MVEEINETSVNAIRATREILVYFICCSFQRFTAIKLPGCLGRAAIAISMLPLPLLGASKKLGLKRPGYLLDRVSCAS